MIRPIKLSTALSTIALSGLSLQLWAGFVFFDWWHGRLLYVANAAGCTLFAIASFPLVLVSTASTIEKGVALLGATLNGLALLFLLLLKANG